MNPNPATAESLVFGRLTEMAVELHRALVGNAISSRRVRRAEVQALIDRLIGARLVLVSLPGADDANVAWRESSQALDLAKRYGFEWMA